MKHRVTSIVLTSALGLGGVATGIVVAPGMAVAATSETSTADAVGDRVTRITEALAGLVSDGSITQAQADEVATVLAKSTPRGGHGGPGGPGGHGRPGKHLDAAAEALGTTVDELRTALEDGQSLAQVAESKGVSRDDLVAALVAEAEEHLAEHVEDGDITQEQADERKTQIAERVDEMVDREGLPARGERHGPPAAEDDAATTETSALIS